MDVLFNVGTRFTSHRVALRRFRRRYVPILPHLQGFLRFLMSFVHRERVRFGDLDANRHLNNVVFLRYFETARIAYLRALVPSHDPSNPESDALGVIFAECHINYRKPVYFDQELEVRCSITSVRRSSFRVEFDMRVESRLVAEGYGVLVGFDYAAEQAAPLADALRERLEQEAQQVPAS